MMLLHPMFLGTPSPRRCNRPNASPLSANYHKRKKAIDSNNLYHFCDKYVDDDDEQGNEDDGGDNNYVDYSDSFTDDATLQVVIRVR